ncbi:MAG: hypothetical protein IT222_00685, partial [Crocinitomix sp.]|nr:hypothetical protein [Crocinitomix sp.]
MKSIILLLPLLLLIGCDAFNDPKEYATSVLYDCTGDTLPYSPESVIKQLHLEDDPWSGRSFRFIPITDVDINPVEELKLPSATEWSSVLDERNDAIDSFTFRIRSVLPTPSPGFEKSSLWIPLMNEIEHLEKSGCDHSTIYFLSDMLMHDDILNFYDDKTRSDLFKNPQALRDRLRRYLPTDTISNIEVVIIYQPKGSDENQFFRQMIDSV